MLRGEAATSAADIFSYGVVMYLALCGRLYVPGASQAQQVGGAAVEVLESALLNDRQQRGEADALLAAEYFAISVSAQPDNVEARKASFLSVLGRIRLARHQLGRVTLDPDDIVISVSKWVNGLQEESLIASAPIEMAGEAGVDQGMESAPH